MYALIAIVFLTLKSSANSMITIKKGLDLPIAGKPAQVIHSGNAVNQVAILGEEYVGMRPSMRYAKAMLLKKAKCFLKTRKTLEWSLQPLRVVLSL